MTLHLLSSGAIIINGRQNQDVLNKNQVQVEDGLLTWLWLPEDADIVSGTFHGEIETHVATVTVFFDSGLGERSFQLFMRVRKILGVE
jgi:hypothetical protein